MLVKIVDLAKTKFNSINGQTVDVEQIKEDHFDEQTSMEYTQLNPALCESQYQHETFADEVMNLTSNCIKEK